MKLSMFFVSIVLLLSISISYAGKKHLRSYEQGRDPSATREVNDLRHRIVPVATDHFRTTTLDDPVGSVYQAGTTWYDMQHNNTAGKMISLDSAGMIRVVWTNGLSAGSSSRHVYYNVWDPATAAFASPNGYAVDGAYRGGYVSQTTLANGFCFPAFHESLEFQLNAKFRGKYQCQS